MTKRKGHHELHGFGNGVRSVGRHVRSRCGAAEIKKLGLAQDVDRHTWG